MKKLFIAALLAISVSASAFAAGINSNAATQNFSFEFKKASNVTWTATDDFMKASFVIDNQKMEAFYNADGERVATSKAISIEELPVSAKRRFAQKYEGYTVKEAIRFDGAEESAYYISAYKDNQNVILKVQDNGAVSTFTPNIK